ncbi:hypothetical protein WJR50_23360 [Catalinimonas sp. 4WD22]|uniref:hypothetical protein n=1 Tax=Catalinimonas locisalis TaxID=3133978 RepID=UPI003101139C
MPLKNNDNTFQRLLKFRYALSIVILFGLFFPFIMQQTFYPFFRFGMFAEPVKRDIQTEYFLLLGIHENGFVDKNVGDLAGIDQSKLNYLLRNYYYRKETDHFTKQFFELLPATNTIDTIFVVRKLLNDSSVIARYPQL